MELLGRGRGGGRGRQRAHCVSGCARVFICSAQGPAGRPVHAHGELMSALHTRVIRESHRGAPAPWFSLQLQPCVSDITHPI